MKTRWLLKLLIFTSIFHECHGEEKVDQLDKLITESEGGSVTLHCEYKTASGWPELLWYIQIVNNFSKYILRRNTYGAGDNGTEFQERFYSEVKSDSVPLRIQDLHVSDSAVYYCALRPTVTKTQSTLTQKQRKLSVLLQGLLYNPTKSNSYKLSSCNVM